MTTCAGDHTATLEEFELAYHATCRFISSGKTEPMILLFGRHNGGLKKIGAVKLILSPKDYSGHMRVLGMMLGMDEVDLTAYVQESAGMDPGRAPVTVHLVSRTLEASITTVRDRESGLLAVRPLDARMVTLRSHTRHMH